MPNIFDFFAPSEEKRQCTEGNMKLIRVITEIEALQADVRLNKTLMQSNEKIKHTYWRRPWDAYHSHFNDENAKLMMENNTKDEKLKQLKEQQVALEKQMDQCAQLGHMISSQLALTK